MELKSVYPNPTPHPILAIFPSEKMVPHIVPHIVPHRVPHMVERFLPITPFFNVGGMVPHMVPHMVERFLPITP
jgi:hypothetical protein